MTTLSISDPVEAQSYLQHVEIVTPLPSSLERNIVSEAALPSYQDGQAQAVAVGSQIAEFAANVPQGLRPQISNAFLLAQLAANKTVDNAEGSTQAWYDRYVEVLANIGWIIESEAFSKRDVSGSTLQVHQEIIPVLTLALGPAVAAAAMVTSFLNGLANMDEKSPWITLFDRESQRATTNQFQISYAEAPEGSAPRISLTCFELDASRSITQVLFFKFSQSNASLRHFSAGLSMNAAVFERVKGVLEDRVADYVTGYVAAIDI